MKKYSKVMLVLVVALSMLCTFALAAGNPFDGYTKNVEAGNITSSINNIGGTVISVIQTLGYVIAVVMVLVLAIQWLIGTPAKKQELKGKMWNILIGAVLLIAGVTILGAIADFADGAKGQLVTSAIETVEVRA